MHNYNFLNLSPSEFEDLTRDLLQKKLNVYIESFTDGKDLGIDLRCTTLDMDKTIIQCKRYKSYNSLIASLKKELPKLQEASLTRYIVVTSVGLTPPQKDKITNCLHPYIKDTEDILGRDDLNNLIGQFEKIEHKYFKLWLSSTTILKKILYNKIINQSNFEIEKIEESLKFYVQNESLDICKKIIAKNKFVIISGQPGIGKTTLARMLTYYYFSKGFENFVYINKSIKEGYDFYEEEKKQIFFFDDFLGKNFLKTNLPINEEQSIISFLGKIKKSSNKILIVTTREYILNQGQSEYESLNNNIINKSKCIVGLSKYTNLVKATILYNHLFFNELPSSHISELLKNCFFNEIISHPNYNPRIIKVATQKEVWENIAPEDYPQTFISFLDYPESVWRHAYEKHISSLSRYMLALLLTTGTPIYLDDLFKLVDSFCSNNSTKYNVNFDHFSKTDSIKELTNTFIKTELDSRRKSIVKYQNPSIQDFMVHYFTKSPDLIQDIIKSAIYINQLNTIFTFQKTYSVGLDTIKKIYLDEVLQNIYYKKVINDYDSLGVSCINFSYKFNGDTMEYFWEKPELSDMYKLDAILNNMDFAHLSKLKEFIINKFNSFINSDEPLSGFHNIHLFSQIVSKIHHFIKADTTSIFQKIVSAINYADELWCLSIVKSIYPREFNSYSKKNAYFAQVLEKVVQNTIEPNVPILSIKTEVLNDLYRLKNEYNCNVDSQIKDFEEKLKDEKNDELYKNPSFIESISKSISKSISEEAKKEREEQKIKNMYDSLK
ncbi:nSTAND3 domain-containing NTPase [Aureispira anguillae]|nr:restriction endonuclease [Aureispira anguillae]